VRVKVVDASVWAAIAFGEPGAEEISRELEGCDLVAPSHLPLEMASVCLKKMRRTPQQKEALLAAWHLWRRASVRYRQPDSDGVFDLAAKTGLTPYDAAYLWLAKDESAELVTLDEELEKAAKKY
jgi:predicted nucleic acid-binding protein